MKEKFKTCKTESEAKEAVAILTKMGEVAWNEDCTVFVDYEEADRRRREQAEKEKPAQ